MKNNKKNYIKIRLNFNNRMKDFKCYNNIKKLKSMRSKKKLNNKIIIRIFQIINNKNEPKIVIQKIKWIKDRKSFKRIF